jgi:hypothetical protein
VPFPRDELAVRHHSSVSRLLENEKVVAANVKGKQKDMKRRRKL